MSNPIIYLGFENAFNQSISEDVERMGLNLIKASPWEIAFTCSVDEEQSGYGIYLTAFSSYVLATHTRNRVKITNYGISVPPIPDQHMLPFPRPPVVFMFTVQPNQDVLNRVESCGGKLQTVHNKTMYTIDNYGPTDLTFFKTHGADVKTKTYTNTTNIHTMRALKICCTIMSWFTYVHYYPAFYSIEPTESEDEEDESLFETRYYSQCTLRV